MISKLRVLLWVGTVLIFLPFLGVPDSWKTALTIALGFVVTYMSFKLKRAYKRLRFELRQQQHPVPETTHDQA